jgi:hypothetical protein
MSINRVYHIWFERIMQMYPQLCLTQRRNLAWMLSGIYKSRSVQLHRIAGKIPSLAKLPSLVMRLRRFMKNSVLRVRPMYEPVAREWLEFQARTTGRIRLGLDGTKVGSGHQLLMVSILFRRRAVPLVWTWVRHAKGHSSANKQITMLAYARKLLPQGVPVTLVGDTEFESGELQRHLQKWQWGYVLRQKANNQVQALDDGPWQPFRNLITRPGQSIWLSEVLLTRKHALPVNLLAYWKPGEKRPWLLATNFTTPRQALKVYRRRVWIEEMFGDLKQHALTLRVPICVTSCASLA